MAIQWRVGDRIYGRWEVRRVHRGGMAEVYVVYDRQRQVVLAAKTCQDRLLAHQPGLADGFVREARTWVALDAHPHVTRAHFVRRIEGKPYLFLEYVSGTLRDWIGTPRLADDLAQVLRFGLQVCDGMGHVLAKGIQAHGDLKPANCLITREGTLKISDFGLARAFEPAGAGFGQRAGTWAYMAPERFVREVEATARTDVYALGIMLFEMLAGHVPYAARTWREFGQLHRRYALPAAPAFTRKPAGVRRLVQTCLAKDPEARFADFAQVREALAAAYAAAAGTPAPPPAASGELDRVSWTQKGMSLAELGRHGEALACYDQALALGPGYVPAWTYRGASLLELGRPEEALESLDRALGADRRYAPAWTHMGLAMAALGKLREAERCHTRALEIDRHYAPAWTSKGLTLSALGRPREALRFHGRAVELNPWYAAAWVHRGQALQELGDPEKALWCHNQALERDLWHVPAWTHKALVLLALGQQREALLCAERALELDAGAPLAWVAKGMAMAGVRQWEESLQCCRQASDLDPGHLLAQQHQGIALAALGRHSEALACYDRILESDRGHVAAWLHKGISLAALGRASQALACCNRALRFDPKCALAWQSKGRILGQELRRHREAATCLARARRLATIETPKAAARRRPARRR